MLPRKGEFVTAKLHGKSTRRTSVHVVGELRESRRVVTILTLSLALTACGAQGERPLQGYVEGEYVRVAAPFAGALQQLAVKRVIRLRRAHRCSRSRRKTR
jgi:hypothetical protein